MKTVLILTGMMLACGCWANAVPGKGRNPEAVAQVAAGALTTANASWWGFDSEDATDALQGAINSKAKTVIVPFMNEPWQVRPIFLRSNLELIFEPVVVVVAKKDQFKGRQDSLLSGNNQSDIIIRGYGAVLRMRKKRLSAPALSRSWSRIRVPARTASLGL